MKQKSFAIKRCHWVLYQSYYQWYYHSPSTHLLRPSSVEQTLNRFVSIFGFFLVWSWTHSDLPVMVGHALPWKTVLLPYALSPVRTAMLFGNAVDVRTHRNYPNATWRRQFRQNEGESSPKRACFWLNHLRSAIKSYSLWAISPLPLIISSRRKLFAADPLLM